MSWVNDLSKRRAPLVGNKPEAKASAAGKNKLQADPAIVELAQVGLSEKVLLQYGASLKPALDDARAVFSTAATLRPHRAGQFQRALERFYGDLGKNLSKQPDASREQAAKVAIAALRTLVERVGASEVVVGGIAALGAMLFVGSSKPAELEARGQAAIKVLNQTLDALEGRTGATTILFGVRNLLELAEKEHKGAKLAEREKLWRQVVALHLDTTPPSGADQAQIGELASAFIENLKQTREPFAAIQRTSEQTIAAQAGFWNAIRQQLLNPPGNPVAQALSELLAKHRAGPESMLQAVEAMALAVAQHAHAFTPENEAVSRGLTAVIKASAGSAAADAVLQHLAFTLPQLFANPAAAEPLLAVKTGADVPRALVLSQMIVLGQGQGALDDPLQSLDRLPAPIAQRAAIAALPYLNNPAVAQPLLEALPDFARHTDSLDAVVRYTTSFVGTYPQALGAVGALPNEARLVSSALAIELNGTEDNARLQSTNAALLGIMRHFPKASIPALLRPSNKGESSLLELKGTNELGRDPAQLLNVMLPGIVASNPPDDQQAGYVRRAITIANSLARLDRDPGPLMQRIADDWTLAGAQPELLHFALKPGAALAVRAKGQPNIIGFLEAHPELPAEVAISAGLALSSEQLAWLIEQIKGTKSHGRVRELRDLVFALSNAGRVDMVDTLRNAANTKAVGRTIHFIATEYRQGRLGQLPFDRLRDGLNQGEDPVTKLENEASAAAFAALGIGGEAKGPLDPAGVAELQACQAHLQGLTSVLKPEVQVWGDPTTVYRETLETCLREVVTGSWPHFKYEGPVGVEQLKGLTPQQRAIWMQEDVTVAQANAPAEGEIGPVLHLLSGLSKVLPKLELSNRSVGKVAWDADSRNKLKNDVDGLLAQLHELKKGSEDHRKLSKKIGPLSDRLALLELYTLIQGLIDPPNKPAAQMLQAVKGALPAAKAAAARLGAGPGVSEAIADLAAEASQLKAAAREGRYAADEHHVSAVLTSFDSGCIAARGGGNQPSMVEFIASAQYKMGRAFENGVPVLRTIWRLLQVEIGKYKGYALRIDPPQGTGQGGANAEHTKLMYAHAIKKAMAMGIPCIVSDDAGMAAELGLKMVPANGNFSFHRGYTGTHHTQGLNVGPYFTVWPGVKLDGANVGHRLEAETPMVTLPGALQAVFPPGIEV